MLNDKYVIDAVIHSYNLDPRNHAVPRNAEGITEMIFGVVAGSGPEYELTREQYVRDWDVDETVSTLFLESQTDFAIYHPVPIGAYRDGLVSVEKAAEVLAKHPTRFLSYATVDPMAGQAALDELERQAELLNPIGLKLYPSSWTAEGKHRHFRMDDEQVVYPLYEKAKELGISTVAVHKAVPLGPVPMDPYRVGDLDVAAHDHPDLNFEIVHGGVAFVEETAWLLARFPNVFVNLETLNIICAKRPDQFARAVLGMAAVVGDHVYDRMWWGTGHMAYHARPCLEAFEAFRFTDADLELAGQFAPVSQITDEHKAKILAGNYVSALGLDLDKIKAGTAADELERQRAEGLRAPWSTSRTPVGA
ncbi:amidohydrolase family protein [Amycolatopsis acidicola]|uniref:Amidohydrolase family protein n=1 Tax=Amycolatopsis acidicola TaxID=2596893 RepID=A0A5N0UNK9_9PSEU|nr:amidohydrolase family protein [Amycolatopsis acidicola]KAA9151846.1 amidohydrolase family protein [Amycolatopsis acidicola]